MEQSKFSFELTPTNPAVGLGFEVWINNDCVFVNESVTESTTVLCDLPSDSVESDHWLKFILKNKLSEHTQISDNGEILHDSCLEISKMAFDDIELGFDILQNFTYSHNCNGTTELKEHQFFGTMGCNGSAELKFSTPIYLWLLENM
jgi:hypothetical protein